MAFEFFDDFGKSGSFGYMLKIQFSSPFVVKVRVLKFSDLFECIYVLKQ